MKNFREILFYILTFCAGPIFLIYSIWNHDLGENFVGSIFFTIVFILLTQVYIEEFFSYKKQNEENELK